MCQRSIGEGKKDRRSRRSVDHFFPLKTNGIDFVLFCWCVGGNPVDDGMISFHNVISSTSPLHHCVCISLPLLPPPTPPLLASAHSTNSLATSIDTLMLTEITITVSDGCQIQIRIQNSESDLLWWCSAVSSRSCFVLFCFVLFYFVPRYICLPQDGPVRLETTRKNISRDLLFAARWFVSFLRIRYAPCRWDLSGRYGFQ